MTNTFSKMSLPPAYDEANNSKGDIQEFASKYENLEKDETTHSVIGDSCA